jgi:hypothetical protein
MGLETGVVESNEIATLVVHKSDSVGRETLQQDLPELVGLQYRETYRVEEPLQPTIGTDIERTS